MERKAVTKVDQYTSFEPYFSNTGSEIADTTGMAGSKLVLHGVLLSDILLCPAVFVARVIDGASAPAAFLSQLDHLGFNLVVDH